MSLCQLKAKANKSFKWRHPVMGLPRDLLKERAMPARYGSPVEA